MAAHELGFLSREDAIAKLRRELATLERLENHRGFHFNFYDTTSLERTSHFVSFVDSAWLAAGLMVVRRGMPELAPVATRLLGERDYGDVLGPATSADVARLLRGRRAAARPTTTPRSTPRRASAA